MTPEQKNAALAEHRCAASNFYEDVWNDDNRAWLVWGNVPYLGIRLSYMSNWSGGALEHTECELRLP